MAAMIGNAAGHGGLEGDRAAQLAGPVEQLRPVLGQQGLVGRDDVLAAFQQLQHDRPGGLQPADQLDRRDDLGLSITLDRSAVSMPGGRAKFRGRFRSGSTTWTSSSLLPALGDPVALLQQQPGHAGADRSEPDDGDFGGIHGQTTRRFMVMMGFYDNRGLLS